MVAYLDLEYVAVDAAAAAVAVELGILEISLV